MQYEQKIQLYYHHVVNILFLEQNSFLVVFAITSYVFLVYYVFSWYLVNHIAIKTFHWTLIKPMIIT